jgi:hypothetical protein
MTPVPIRSAIPYQAVTYAMQTVMSFNDTRDEILWLPDLHVLRVKHRASGGIAVVPLTNIACMTPFEDFVSPPASPARSRGGNAA